MLRTSLPTVLHELTGAFPFIQSCSLTVRPCYRFMGHNDFPPKARVLGPQFLRTRLSGKNESAEFKIKVGPWKNGQLLQSNLDFYSEDIEESIVFFHCSAE